jgi:hypothetical protein
MSPLWHRETVGVYGDADGGIDMMQVEWTGVDEFTRFLKETPGLVAKDVKAALYQEGENAMGVSKQRTPVDVGNLKASGHVKLPEVKKGGVTVTLAYGTDYAIYVHEIPARHASGQSKFLESAIKDNAKGMPGRLRSRILDRIGRRL